MKYIDIHKQTNSGYWVEMSWFVFLCWRLICPELGLFIFGCLLRAVLMILHIGNHLDVIPEIVRLLFNNTSTFNVSGHKRILFEGFPPCLRSFDPAFLFWRLVCPELRLLNFCSHLCALFLTWDILRFSNVVPEIVRLLLNQTSCGNFMSEENRCS